MTSYDFGIFGQETANSNQTKLLISIERINSQATSDKLKRDRGSRDTSLSDGKEESNILPGTNRLFGLFPVMVVLQFF